MDKIKPRQIVLTILIFYQLKQVVKKTDKVKTSTQRHWLIKLHGIS